MIGRHLTRRGIPALVAALSLGAVGAADASTVRVDPSGKLQITETAGLTENNVITVRRVADLNSDGGPRTNQVYIVRDSSGSNKPQDYPGNFPQPIPIPVIADIGCTSVDTYTVRCTSAGTQDGEIKSIQADLAAGFNYFSPIPDAYGPIAPATVTGGASSDFFKGGEQNDVLDGAGGDDTLQGFGGNDTLKPGTGANSVYGSDRSYEGTTDPDLGDTVDYSSIARSAGQDGVAVSLDGTSDDGANCFPGVGTTQCDNVYPDVENVTGTEGRDIIVTQSGAVDNTVKGLGGTDRITTNDGVDTVDGAGGDNVIETGGGDDTITADDGANQVNSGGSIDTITLGDGANTVTAGAGDDAVTAGDGGNTVSTDAGDDAITTGSGADTIDAGGGADTIDAGAGNDDISGGDGSETKILAGAGDDVVRGGLGADLGMDGGDGVDTLTYDDKTASVFATLNQSDAKSGTGCADQASAGCEGDTIVAGTFENLRGGSAGDRLIGSDAAANTIEGLGGNDTLEGLALTDKLLGGDGDDELVGGADSDELHGGQGAGDAVSYSDATASQPVRVTLDGTANDGRSCPGGSCENDNLFSDIENITGGAGNDYLEGADPNNADGISGNNRLDGLAGHDVLNGKLGADVMNGGSGVDTATWLGRTQDLNVSLDGVANDGASGEGDNAAADVEHVTTGSGNDTVTGSAAANAITTNEGNDTIVALEGNDQLFAGPGNDSLDAGDGNDRLASGDGNDSLVAGAGDDTLDAAGGDDLLDGGTGSDDVVGGAGNDTGRYSGRGSATVVNVTLDDARNDGQSGELDNVHYDIENLAGGDERDVFEGSNKINVLTGGAGNDALSGGAEADTLQGGDGNDLLHGDSENDLLVGGAGADNINGEGGDDTVDYSDRAAGTVVDVTLDETANDGEAGEGDNVRRDVENVRRPAAAPPVAPVQEQPAAEQQPAAQQQPAAEQQQQQPASEPLQQQSQSTSGSSGGQTTAVTTTQKAGTSMELLVKRVKGKSRSVLVRGRILVKARNGLAQSSAACQRGGKVRVTLYQGKRVVGSKLVKLSRNCTFRAPVVLAKGAKGKLKVEVRFLGNRALKATKRTTSLQVNG